MSISSSGDWARSWIEGRTVLVTGGTGGIGGAIASGFAEAGASVVATGSTRAELDASRAVRGNVDHRLLDVRDMASVSDLVGSLDRLDVVVNCAGIIRRDDEMDPAVFETVVDINLNGTMRVCSACVDKLTESGGSIINIASMLSFFGGGVVPGYSSSKGGIAQLTKSLAIAYAPRNVRVNAIAPGWIATPLTKALQDDPVRGGAILGRTPMARWGTPEDVVGPTLFLASPHATFMTGTVVPVDGGYAIC